MISGLSSVSCLLGCCLFSKQTKFSSCNHAQARDKSVGWGGVGIPDRTADIALLKLKRNFFTNPYALVFLVLKNVH